MRSRVQDATRQEKTTDGWTTVVEKAQSRERDSKRRTGTGSPPEMEKAAAWREEERHQKEEGAGQGPKMKNGEQEGDAKKKICSMTGKKNRGGDLDEER